MVFETLYRFKGLERDVVILLDLPGSPVTDKHRYVAASRARHLLAVVCLSGGSISMTSFRDESAPSRTLPYDMGNAGDLLKHGVLAEFVPLAMRLGKVVPLLRSVRRRTRVGCQRRSGEARSGVAGRGVACGANAHR